MANGIASTEMEEPGFLANVEDGVPIRLAGISWREYLDLSERMSHRRLRTTCSKASRSVRDAIDPRVPSWVRQQIAAGWGN